MSCSVQVFMLFHRRPTCWHTVRGLGIVSDAPEFAFTFKTGDCSYFLWLRRDLPKWSSVCSQLPWVSEQRAQVDSPSLWRSQHAMRLPGSLFFGDLSLEKNSLQMGSIVKMHRTGGKWMAWRKIQKLQTISVHSLPTSLQNLMESGTWNHCYLSFVSFFRMPKGLLQQKLTQPCFPCDSIKAKHFCSLTVFLIMEDF